MFCIINKFTIHQWCMSFRSISNDPGSEIVNKLGTDDKILSIQSSTFNTFSFNLPMTKTFLHQYFVLKKYHVNNLKVIR